jgi:hypothetical protein
VGHRQPTKLEAQRIERGEMSPAELLPKEKPATAQPGRLAPRLRPINAPIQPQASQPTLADIMAAIERIETKLDKVMERPQCSCKASKGTEQICSRPAL